MEAIDLGDVRAIMLGIMDANAKLDAILYFLLGGEDEEEEDEADA